MNIAKFSYAQVEGCLYEAMRTMIKGGEVFAEREGKALIDPTLTCHNITYVHDCLKPAAMQPARKKKDKNGATVYCRKDADGNVAEYVRGQGVADYHNSQVKSKLNKARMTGSDKELSKAMGFIVTLPKNYLQNIVPDLSDGEYKYLVSKLEAEQLHQPFKTDEVYEQSLNYKFRKHEWTLDEMEKAKDFLLAAKDCVLAELGIRKQDVLFYSIHFDESFPHIHCMALPTLEKTYEEDVYSKKMKKDGTYTLLHKKGDTDVSYSVSQYYSERTNDGEYAFFKNFHENIVKRMAKKGFAAECLVNGVTSGRCFDPQQMSYSQREQSVRQAMEILALQKKLKELEATRSVMQKEFDETYSAMKSKLKGLKIEKETAQAEAKAYKQEAAKAAEEIEQAKDLLEEKNIELEEKMEQINSLRQLIRELKTELSSLAEKFAMFVPNVLKNFLTKWKEAKTFYQMEKIDQAAQDEARAGAKALVANLGELSSRAEAILVDEDVVNGVKMATFVQTGQKVGFARKQILKAAEAAGRAEVFERETAMSVALQDWFNREKYEKIIENKSEMDAYLYMKSPARAARAIEYLDACVEAGLVEFCGFERG